MPDIKDIRIRCVFIAFIAIFPPVNDAANNVAIIQYPTFFHSIDWCSSITAIQAVAAMVMIAAVNNEMLNPSGIDVAFPDFLFTSFPPPLL